MAPPPEGSDVNPGTFAQPWARSTPDLGAYEWNSDLIFKDGFQGIGN